MKIGACGGQSRAHLQNTGHHRLCEPHRGNRILRQRGLGAARTDPQFPASSRYYQLPSIWREFVPDLSIIDMLMFCSKEEIQKILNEYDIL